MSLFESASLVITPNGTKASKLYAIKPTDGSGDLSVTRATTATRVNSSGLIESVATNVPRLDYTNGTCPSILVEPQRTNLQLYSEDFTNLVWTKVNTTITANSINSPSGIATADSLLDNSDNNVHALISVVSKATSAITYTFSTYAKLKDSGKKIFLGVDDAVAGGCDSGVFNLSTGTWDTAIGTPSASFTNPSRSFQNVGNGWYRLSFTITSNTQAQIRSNIFVSNSSNQITYVGDGTGIYVWGAQLEVGNYATSYIPTVASAVTRNADVISKTGISSLIGQTEGTMFFDIYRPTLNAPFFYIIANSVGTNNYLNSIFIYQNANGNIRTECLVSGVQQSGISTSGLSVGRHKIAVAYKQNDFALYIDGILIGNDTSGNIPPLSAFEINGTDAGSIANMNINVSALWKTRLTNAELATLTTI